MDSISKETKEIGAYEAKTHFSQILDKVSEGESFIVTRRGKIVAEIKPCKKEEKNKIVRKRGCLGSFKDVYISDDFDDLLEDFAEYQ